MRSFLLADYRIWWDVSEWIFFPSIFVSMGKCLNLCISVEKLDCISLLDVSWMFVEWCHLWMSMRLAGVMMCTNRLQLNFHHPNLLMFVQFLTIDYLVIIVLALALSLSLSLSLLICTFSNNFSHFLWYYVQFIMLNNQLLHELAFLITCWYVVELLFQNYQEMTTFV